MSIYRDYRGTQTKPDFMHQEWWHCTIFWTTGNKCSIWILWKRMERGCFQGKSKLPVSTTSVPNSSQRDCCGGLDYAHVAQVKWWYSMGDNSTWFHMIKSAPFDQFTECKLGKSPWRRCWWLLLWQIHPGIYSCWTTTFASSLTHVDTPYIHGYPLRMWLHCQDFPVSLFGKGFGWFWLPNPPVAE